MLVGIRRVVFLGDEIREQAVGERLVAVRMDARDVDGDRVVVSDVLAERLPRLAIEHDDAHHPLEADEEVVLAALVEMQPADHAAARAGQVRLLDRLRQRARPDQLHEPASFVFVLRKREARDHQPCRPRTKSLTS